MHYSEPGIDSIPYSAWAAFDIGLDVLAEAMMWIMSGQFLFKSSNDTLQVWLPKGEGVDDSWATGCTRAPSAVRDLGLRSADIKLITATINLQFSKLLMDWA
eukprot:8924102-Pyramimonas_sp.AAC.1